MLERITKYTLMPLMDYSVAKWLFLVSWLTPKLSFQCLKSKILCNGLFQW